MQETEFSGQNKQYWKGQLPSEAVLLTYRVIYDAAQTVRRLRK